MNKSPGNKDFKVGGRGARGVLITCSLLYLVNNMDRYVLAVVIQPMKDALGVTARMASSTRTERAS